MYSHAAKKILALCTLVLFFNPVPYLSAEIARDPDDFSLTLLYSTNVLGEFEPCG